MSLSELIEQFARSLENLVKIAESILRLLQEGLPEQEPEQKEERQGRKG